jgi:hypothetical protein
MVRWQSSLLHTKVRAYQSLYACPFTDKLKSNCVSPGQPADNAAHFVEWLSGLQGNEAANASFAVFGCGSTEWPRSYQRVPRLIDDALAARGARRLLERAEGNSAAAEFFEAFDTFEDKLWDILEKVRLVPFSLPFGWLPNSAITGLWNQVQCKGRYTSD